MGAAVSDQSQWRLNTADEIELQLSAGASVVIDHETTGDPLPQSKATLAILSGGVSAQVGDLTPADLRLIASSCIEFADRMEGHRLQDLRSKVASAAAAEPAEPQESRQDSGTGTDAQQEATGFYGTGWYRLRAFDPQVVYVYTADLHRLYGTYRDRRECWQAGSGKHRADKCGPRMRDIVAGPFATEAEALAWSPDAFEWVVGKWYRFQDGHAGFMRSWSREGNVDCEWFIDPKTGVASGLAAIDVDLSCCTIVAGPFNTREEAEAV